MAHVHGAARIAAVLVPTLLALSAAPARSYDVVYSPAQLSCFDSVAKAGLTMTRGKMKLVFKCRNAHLKNGSCAAPNPGTIGAIDKRLDDAVVAGCSSLTAADFDNMGLPCRAPADGVFDVADLQDCMRESHDDAVAVFTAETYDDTLDRLAGGELKCQTAIAKAVAKLVSVRMRALRECRRQIINGDLVLWPEDCESEHEGTREAILDAEGHLTADVFRRCTDQQIAALRVCTSNETTREEAARCLIEGAGFAASRLYCGDQIVDGHEECDGRNDAACPGRCGAPMTPDACQCIGPRLTVHEHTGADFDWGWTGLAHDQDFAAGSYVVDLGGCNGPGGPDTECVVGPSCSEPPHSPCSPAADQFVSGDAICAGLGQGRCRKSAGAFTGPRCEFERQRRCDDNSQCPRRHERCEKQPHGAPLPMSAGGIPLCIVNVFSEDVVGTADLATGAAAVRLRQRSQVHLGGSLEQPCPVCGSICFGRLNPTEPGEDRWCTSDADCPGTFCLIGACTYGSNVDGYCRPEAPFGIAPGRYGPSSSYCPPGNESITGPGLDMLFDTLTTAAVSLTAAHACTDPAFAGRACVGGASDQRPCTTDLDCPNGSCRGQCFCAGQGKPNACASACVGGADDAMPCTDDAACDPPNGFCHRGDCRTDPSDAGSVQEGRCTAGPIIGACSVSSLAACTSDDDCGGVSCPSCEPGETCVLEPQRCFVNGTIERAGTPGGPNRKVSAIFCTAPTDTPSVNDLVGLPGPAALTQPQTFAPEFP